MSYSLYTFLTNNIWMMITIPLIIYGVFRYVFLVISQDMGGEPEILFKDAGMLTCMILWAVSITGILYLKM
jgi:ABC-type phosphate transport system permease subunit